MLWNLLDVILSQLWPSEYVQNCGEMKEAFVPTTSFNDWEFFFVILRLFSFRIKKRLKNLFHLFWICRFNASVHNLKLTAVKHYIEQISMNWWVFCKENYRATSIIFRVAIFEMCPTFYDNIVFRKLLGIWKKFY